MFMPSTFNLQPSIKVHQDCINRIHLVVTHNIVKNVHDSKAFKSNYLFVENIQSFKNSSFMFNILINILIVNV